MLKIGHFIDSLDPGGAESVVIELCKEQIKRNNIVEVLHFGNPWLAEKCRLNNINIVRVPFYFLYKSIYTLPLFSILFSIFLLTRRLDIIHTHLFDTVLPTVPASLITRIRHIATLHDVYSIENNRIRHTILKYAAVFGTTLVAVSNQIINHLYDYGVVKKDSVFLVRNGVDLNKFSPITNQHNTNNRLRNNEGKIVIISVGRLVPIKGFDNLLYAYAQICKQTNKTMLLIVGDGPEMEKLSSLASNLGISERVEFLGQRDDMPELLSNSDIFALASLSEGLSCSIIEAMASGLPIVATHVGGNNELVKNDVNGFLVPDGNTNHLANKLMGLILNDEKRQKLSSMSHSIATQEFSTESMCNKYEELYASSLRY